MPKTLNATKHFWLAQQLRKTVRSMNVGEAIPTVADLRKQYQCSQATVERALDRLRKEGLIVRPAGQLRLTVAEASDPAAHRVAIIRPDYPSPTFEELARQVVEAGKACDWAFDLVYYRTLEGLALQKAIGDNDAAVLLPSTEEFPRHLATVLRRPHRPVIVIQNIPEIVNISSVSIDEEEIGRLSVEYLASLGHRRILAVLNEPGTVNGLRHAGWRKQMEALGQTNLDELTVDVQVRNFENSTLGAYERFNAWLDRPHAPFTGIFCAAWSGAVAVLRALRERNINVPQDVSLISHGGEGYMSAFIHPAITALETDLSVYGRNVVELLQEKFTNPAQAPEHRLIPSTLVPRGTTAHVRA